MSKRTVVVTGGAKGIGKAITSRFGNAGDKVVAPGHDDLDVTDEAAVDEFFDRTGHVDVLVANAGVSASATVAKTTLADWQWQLDVNATGVFLSVRAVLPRMVARDSGRIVVVSSIAGKIGAPYIGGYAASKHAAVGLMRSAAAEVAGTGVTVNAVCPTYVRTDMTRRSVANVSAKTGRTPDESEDALVAMLPLGRLLEPDEVAFAVTFLAAPEAAAINGQTLVLDGGGIQS